MTLIDQKVALGVSSPSQNTKDSLAINLAVDKNGSLPDWYTHFGSSEFNASAYPTIKDCLSTAYPQRSLRITGLGTGRAPYEIAIADSLRSDGWKIHSLIASDLQKDSLETIQETAFTVIPMVGDATHLPFSPIRDGQNAVFSRAIEHYLGKGGLEALIRETGRILSPGELYIAQISSGHPTTLEAFSAGLKAIAGKAEDFLPVEHYVEKVSKVTDKKGLPLFKEIHRGAATSQSRGPLELARRYLTPSFLSSHDGEEWMNEVTQFNSLRSHLGSLVKSGQLTRDEALELLDNHIQQTHAFNLFRNVFNQAVHESWATNQFIQGKGIEETPQGDMILTIDYPVIVWQRQKISDKVNLRRVSRNNTR